MTLNDTIEQNGDIVNDTQMYKTYRFEGDIGYAFTVKHLIS